MEVIKRRLPAGPSVDEIDWDKRLMDNNTRSARRARQVFGGTPKPKVVYDAMKAPPGQMVGRTRPGIGK